MTIENPPCPRPAGFVVWCFVHNLIRGSRRESAHYFRFERTYVRCYAVKSSRVSVRGFGEKIFGRSPSAGIERSANNSFSNFCWSRNVIIISGEGEDLAMMVCVPSCCEMLTMKIKTQTAASPVQIRRQGKMSSSQSCLEDGCSGGLVDRRSAKLRRSQTAATTWIGGWRQASARWLDGGPIKFHAAFSFLASNNFRRDFLA